MAAYQARTREQLRAAVGLNLNGMRPLKAAADGATVSGGTTTFLTDDIASVADDHNGSWFWGNGTNQTGKRYRVYDSSVSSTRTTLNIIITDGGTAVKPVTGDTGELWQMKYDPTQVNSFINQALIEATGIFFPPEESQALHGDARQRRFDLPSEFAMVNGVYYRTYVNSEQIHDAASEWDEAAAPSGITRAVDTEDYKRNGGANRFAIAAAFGTGLVSSKAISAKDLRGYDYVEFWVKSTVATGATTLDLLLDDTAACASAVETLDIPALVADTWTFVRVALANPELDSAIISVGLNVTVDYGATAGYVWVDDVRAVNSSTGRWQRIEPFLWHIDREAEDLVFQIAPSYALLKLTGGSKPTLLTADADVCDIDDQFVIARATELMLASTGAHMNDIAYWHGMAEAAKRRKPMLLDARTVG